MLNITKFNLKQNPFEEVTPTSGDLLIWAGMQEHKQDLTHIYQQTFNSQSKRLILNWGPKGGGKTHAAFYFGNNEIANIDKANLQKQVSAFQ